MPSASCSNAVRALALALYLVGAFAAATAIPAAAQDAKLTEAERAEFVTRTLAAMSPAQRRALEDTIKTDLALAKWQAAHTAPPKQQTMSDEKKKAGMLDRIMGALGSIMSSLFGISTTIPSAEEEENRAQIASLEDTLTVLHGGGNAGSRPVFETVVKKTRLAFLVCGDHVVKRLSGSIYWDDDIDAYTSHHAGTLRSVGMIEVKGLDEPRGDTGCPSPDPAYTPVGTGFVAEKGLLVTNRHVLETFAVNSSGTWTIRPGLNVRVVFGREAPTCRATPMDLSVTAVAAVHPTLDLAALRVEGTSPSPLAIAGGPVSANEAIAVIGYPACDNRVRRLDEAAVFGTPAIFYVERFQPGFVMTAGDTPEQFRHDASTLGGNSGSPVMSLSDGTVLGVHSGGVPYEYNVAVPAAALAEFLRTLPPAGAGATQGAK